MDVVEVRAIAEADILKRIARDWKELQGRLWPLRQQSRWRIGEQISSQLYEDLDKE